MSNIAKYLECKFDKVTIRNIYEYTNVTVDQLMMVKQNTRPQ